MSLFLVSQVAKTRKITSERAKRAVYLQHQLAKPVEKFKPEHRCDLLDEANAMTLTAFCLRCSHHGEWKIGTKQCRDCGLWFCTSHVTNNRCQVCQDVRSMKSTRKSRGK